MGHYRLLRLGRRSDSPNPDQLILKGTRAITA